MSVGLYSRLARIPCAQLRAEVAKKMQFTPQLFLQRSGSEFVSMLRQPTQEELRQIRQWVISQPQYTLIANKSMGEFKDMLLHPQEQTFSLPEIRALLSNLGLEFVGFMLDDDAAIRKEYSAKFPDDKNMDNLLNWDAYEQEKPWTFSGMYLFHCRKITETEAAAAVTEKDAETAAATVGASEDTDEYADDDDYIDDGDDDATIIKKRNDDDYIDDGDDDATIINKRDDDDNDDADEDGKDSAEDSEDGDENESQDEDDEEERLRQQRRRRGGLGIREEEEEEEEALEADYTEVAQPHNFASNKKTR